MAESIRMKHDTDPTYSENLSRGQKASWDKDGERKKKTGERLAERNKSQEVRDKAKLRNKLLRDARYSNIHKEGISYTDPKFEHIVLKITGFENYNYWKRKNLSRYIEYVNSLNA